MTEQTTTTTTPATEVNGAPAPEQATTGKKARSQRKLSERDKAARLAFASEAEARQAKPDHPDWKLVKIVFAEEVKAGTTVFTWATWLPTASAALADLGVDAEFVDKPAKKVTPEAAIDALLAAGTITQKQADAMRQKLQK